MHRSFVFALLVGVCADASSIAGPYTESGIPGFVGDQVNPVFLDWASSYRDYIPAPGVAATWQTPQKALGPVAGSSVDIVSLGDLDQDQINQGLSPGEITLVFDTPIADGAGADFAVFENGVISGGLLFAELGYVDVSSDGVTFARFPSASLTASAVGGYGPVDPTDVYNLAGKHANANGTSLGTPFDLAELTNNAAVLNGSVNLNDIRYVRVTDIPGSGDYKDASGNPIYDAWTTWGSGGFDLEAVGVLNTVPKSDDPTVTPTPGYRVKTLFNSGDNLRGPEVIDTMGDRLVSYEGFYGLEIADPASETIVASYGAPTDGYMVPDGDGFTPWASFVEVEPGEDAIWVGFTTMGNTDDRIYRVDLSDGTWTHKATMAGNFDLEFYGGEPYVSGLNDSSWTTPNSIWKLDVSGANEHDQVIEIGGNSAGFAVSDDADVVSVTYSTTAGEAELWQWDASAIATAIGDGCLTKSDGTLLSELSSGGYDTEIDAAGNIVFSCNETGDGALLVWPATNKPGDEPIEIASINRETWISFLAVSGDITTNGTAYFVDYFTPGIYAVIGEREPVVLPGDFSGDGVVGSADLDIVRANWGQAVPMGDLSRGDADGDGLVGSSDLDVVRANWGAVGADLAVPEPRIFVWLASGVLGGFRTRRKL